MKTILYKEILLLLSFVVLSSCKKSNSDDIIDNQDSCLLKSFEVREVNQDAINKIVDISNNLYYNSSNTFDYSNCVIKYGEQQDAYKTTTTYDGDYLLELLFTGNDISLEKYTYKYSDGKISRVDIYLNGNEAGKGCLLKRNLSPEYHNSLKRQSNELNLEYFFTISYNEEKPATVNFYSVRESNHLDESIELTWIANNISKINYSHYSGNTKEVTFEYDKKRNPLKGVALNGIFTPCISSYYIILVDQLGLLSYFNENNIVKISGSNSQNFEFILNYDLIYDSELIHEITGSLEGQPDYCLCSTIGYNCD